jgi:prepilin-type N-terminal cleavage/methylation domain-containing protein
MKLLNFSNQSAWGAAPIKSRYARRTAKTSAAGRRCARVRAGRAQTGRRAFSLLEVILSIVILGGCLAILGELVRVGARSARSAQDLTTAQLLCESYMAEMDAGITLPTATEGIIDHYDGSQWAYSVEVEPIEQEGLLEVIVTFQQDPAAVAQPISCRLARWMIDPELIAELELAQAEAEAAAEEMATASSSATDTGSAGSDTSSPESGGER